MNRRLKNVQVGKLPYKTKLLELNSDHEELLLDLTDDDAAVSTQPPNLDLIDSD